MSTRFAVIALVFCLGFCLAVPSTAATYAFPYVLEGSGTATAGSLGAPFDTSFIITSAGGLTGIPDGGGATVDIYLFDSAGSPSKALGGVDICNPCSINVDATTHRVDFRLHDRIVAAGGFGASIIIGAAVVVVAGLDPDHTRVYEVIRNATQNEKAGDADGDGTVAPPDLFYLINLLFAGGASPLPRATEVHELRIEGSPIPSGGSTLLIPDLTEKKGPSTSTAFTNDIVFYMTNAGGHAGVPAVGDITADIYLFQNSGSPLQSGGGMDLCNPCVVTVPIGKRAQFKIEDQINALGGWGALSSVSGFAIVRVGGVDPSSFALTTLEVNARANAFDLLIREVPWSIVTP